MRLLVASLIFFSAMCAGCGGKADQPRNSGGAQEPVSVLFADAPGAARKPADSTAVRARSVTLNKGVADSLGTRKDARIALNLFPDALYEVVADHFERSEAGTSIWLGKLADGTGAFSLAVNGPAVSLVLRDYGKAYYAITPSDSGTNLAYQYDPDKYGECGVTPEHSVISGDPDVQFDPPSAVNASTIKVLVLYTKELEAEWGGRAGTSTAIDNIFAEINGCYRDSGILHSVVPVKEKISRADNPPLLDDELKWLAADSAVATLRKNHQADCVAFLLKSSTDTGTNGIAYTMGKVEKAFEKSAFSVTLGPQAQSNFVLAHELAHNMGACHTTDEPKCAKPAFTYGYGYRFRDSNGVPYRTIMAYPPHIRIGRFSNPALKFQGGVTGTANENNALALNNSAATVAAFRP